MVVHVPAVGIPFATGPACRCGQWPAASWGPVLHAQAHLPSAACPAVTSPPSPPKQAILSVPGVDCCFMGPVDLSHALGLAQRLGFPACFDSPDFQAGCWLARLLFLFGCGLGGTVATRAGNWRGRANRMGIRAGCMGCKPASKVPAQQLSMNAAWRPPLVTTNACPMHRYK